MINDHETVYVVKSTSVADVTRMMVEFITQNNYKQLTKHLYMF